MGQAWFSAMEMQEKTKLAESSRSALVVDDADSPQNKPASEARVSCQIALNAGKGEAS